ncbi:MAG: M48 family metalloprotease [Candidatus Eremiobacteraeota bacterium]|nr:M48 family metalloprotease [Candidatus Eremiobacteraeota bacterium]
MDSLRPVSFRAASPSRSAASAPAAQVPAAQPLDTADIVSVEGFTPAQVGWETVKSVAKTAVEVSLPLVLGATLGWPGLAVGTAISTVSATAGSQALSLSGKAKDGLLMGALPLGMGLSLALPGAGLAALIGLGTTIAIGKGAALLASVGFPLLAGKSTHEKFSQEPKARLAPKTFNPRMTEALKRRLKDEGIEQTGSAAKTVALACQHLGPAAVLAVADQVGAELITPEAADRINQVSMKAHRGEKGADGVTLASLHGTPGLATVHDIVLDSDFVKNAHPAAVAWVKGHEQSHINHKDVLIGTARAALLSMLKKSAWTCPAMAGLALRELELQDAKDSRSRESRADREGFEYALAQGHDRQETLEAIQAVLKQSTEHEELDRHPAGAVRVQDLQNYS